MATEQLSGTIVLIIIAIGVQGFIMLGILVKRQIMKFAIRNRGGPHMHVGHGAPKAMRRETDRNLECVNYIRHEPMLNIMGTSSQKPKHFHRAQALKSFHQLEKDIVTYDPSYTRAPSSNIRKFLLKCTKGPLYGVDTHDIHLLCDEYEHARHHYEPFEEAHLKKLSERILVLRQGFARNRAIKPHPSPAPNGGNLGEKPFQRKKGGRESGSESAAFSRHPVQQGSSRVTLLPARAKDGDKSAKINHLSVEV
eukprot:maker-scaffold5_size1054832-snap-gene-1.17 protein:Tk04019 transcript:maker-scaffold5_size1054832-snap-gene-1.17-mRNA-1 annotation:"c1orf43 homolog"